MLPRKKVIAIKQRLVDGAMTQKQLAEWAGTTRTTISHIATERLFKDVPWPGGSKPASYAVSRKTLLAAADPTNSTIAHLEAENVNLRSELKAAESRSKAGAKARGIIAAVIDEFPKFAKPFSALPAAKDITKKKPIEEHIVLHLSDAHADEVVRAEECTGAEEYNFPVACARAEELVDTVIDWAKQTLSQSFYFPHLWILANGDMTSGQIHGHESRSYYRCQTRNCAAIAQLVSLMVRDLAPHFASVHYVGMSGNHGRMSTVKNHAAPLENWDAMISMMARTYCRDLSNVKFTIPNAYSVTLDINGHGLHLFHGDDVKSNLGIPVYGLLRRQKNLLALGSMGHTVPIRYTACGHFHQGITIADNGGELVTNGAWIGTNPYAFNSFSGYRAPMQLLHGMHAKHGISWRLPVGMRTDRESRGPRRYRIDGGRDVGPVEV